VDKDSPNTFVLKPNLSPRPGDEDVLYFSLEGKDVDGIGPGTDRSLCDVWSENPLTEEVLARIGLPGPDLPDQEVGITMDGTATAAANYPDDFGDPGFLDEDGNQILGPDWAFATGPQDASVRILVSREVGDSSGDYWLLKLAATQQEVREITFGIFAPEGVNPGAYQVLGCGTPGTEFFHNCAEAPFPWINAAMSRTVHGNNINIATPQVLWITLHGASASADDEVDHKVLLPVPSTETEEQLVSLAVLKVPQSVSDPNTPPTLFQDETQAGTAAGGGPPILTVLGPHSLDDRNLTEQAANNVDSDGDGISEDTDNCRYAWNGFDSNYPLLVQRDVGRLVQPGDEQRPDGRGDVCQCGEGNGTGEITDTDLTKLREVLARSHITGVDVDERARCSVAVDDESGNGQSCNIKDLVDLNLALASGSFPSGNGNVCKRALVENLTPD
jgi:hypothetical protein